MWIENEFIKQQGKLPKVDGRPISPGGLLRRCVERLIEKDDTGRKEISESLGIDRSYLAYMELDKRPIPARIDFFQNLHRLGIPWDVLSKILIAGGKPSLLVPEEPALYEFTKRQYRQLLGEFVREAGICSPQLAPQIGYDSTYVWRVISDEEGAFFRRPDTHLKIAHALKLRDYQFAELLLVGNPPEELVPILYQALDRE